MSKVQTINLKGNEYATVPQRLKQFREDNPRASIETKPTFNPDGSVMFSTKIIADKAKTDSAEATGTSYGELKESKAFEKLETISVGRALALLGYLNNGQVATTEEMQEFEEYKQDQFQLVLDKIKLAKKRDEFAEILQGLTPEQKQLATPIIQERIQELKEESKDGNSDRS